METMGKRLENVVCPRLFARLFAWRRLVGLVAAFVLVSAFSWNYSVPAATPKQDLLVQSTGTKEPTRSLKVAVGELPPDQHLIDHFNAHRKDFEELVLLYQTDKRRVWRTVDANYQPFETSEYKDLLKKVGIHHLSNDGGLWVPSSYTVEGTRLAKTLDRARAFAYHGIFFNLNDDRYRRISLRVKAMVWKEYFFVPVPPRVEKGHLWWPISPVDGQLTRSARVLASLDDYPANWHPPRSENPWECVYRQIESQWFLKMCIYAN
jgi:hypothetical protein